MYCQTEMAKAFTFSLSRIRTFSDSGSILESFEARDPSLLQLLFFFFFRLFVFRSFREPIKIFGVLPKSQTRLFLVCTFFVSLRHLRDSIPVGHPSSKGKYNAGFLVRCGKTKKKYSTALESSSFLVALCNTWHCWPNSHREKIGFPSLFSPSLHTVTVRPSRQRWH